jgi:hypothetical protein
MIAAECDADTLGAAIDSARALVVQVVVVVDPASALAHDAAVKAGAEVYHFTWCGDFAQARNAALDHCTGDWVLVLDADEMLQVTNATRLREFLGRGPAIYNLTVTSDQSAADSLDRHFVSNDTPRLFPRLPGIRYRNPIHETPVDDNGVVATNGRAPGLAITHAGYTPEAIERGNKTERNLDILGGMVEANPICPQTRLYLSQSLHAVQSRAAIDQCLLALHHCRLNPWTDTSNTHDQAASDLMSALAVSKQFTRARMEAELICQWRRPDHPGFWVSLANCQLQDGAYNMACSSAHAAKQCLGAKNHHVDLGVTTWLPDTMLGMAHAKLGHADEAIACLARALAMEPTHGREGIEEIYGQLMVGRLSKGA